MLKQELNSLFDLSLSIDKDTANLQTSTCFSIINMLSDSPGIILGDDVGMGKTYIAIATAIYYLNKYPNKQVIVITPSWLLNSKWHNDMRNFIELNLNRKKCSLTEVDIAYITNDDNIYGTYLNQIKIKSQKSKVVIVPINVFSAIGWKHEKSFFLSCWFRHRKLWGKTREKILTALGGDVNIRDPHEFKDMGISYEDIDEKWYENLDKVDISSKIISQDIVNIIWHEIKELRYKSLNMVLPDASLLILDEAHKMKNQDTVKRQSLQNTVTKKFDKTIFLTATPFQLQEGELRSVLEMFEAANITKFEVVEFREKARLLFLEMNKYRDLINLFEFFVSRLTKEESYLIEILVKKEPHEEVSFDVNETYKTYNRIIEQKDSLESIMRKFIIRNIKAKDEYRKEITGSLDINESRGIPLTKDSYLPFAMMEKAIFEILSQGDRTFIASIKQSFTSSYEAAIKTSIYNKDLPSLNMLRQMDITKNKHPKVESIASEVVSTLIKGEKTLIFCDRVETVKTLKYNIQKRLDKSQIRDIEKLFPEIGIKGFDNYCRRFYNKQDSSWLLLQENYIHSVLVSVIDLCGVEDNIIPKANEIERDVEIIYRKYNATTKANYMYLKRIVEHLVFKITLSRIKNWQKKIPMELKYTIDNILHREYIELGLNLNIDEYELDNTDDSENEMRSISTRVINNIINYEGIWNRYRNKLNLLNPAERDDIVSSMISFLRRDKRFFIELRSTNEKYPNKDDSFCISRTFERGDLLDWNKAYERFIEKYCKETIANKEEMILGLKISDVVTSITGETSNDAREKIRAGFNTPFHPQILIATSTMQEGIDLQLECKRVNHYDLEWNPASMEQRVGRIDRINSLVSKLRLQDKNITMDIYYPYIKNTIDESIYKTVKDREKWFNLILGGTPQWDTFEVDPKVTSISPWVFKNIQINLSVKV